MSLAYNLPLTSHYIAVHALRAVIPTTADPCDRGGSFSVRDEDGTPLLTVELEEPD